MYNCIRVENILLFCFYCFLCSASTLFISRLHYISSLVILRKEKLYSPMSWYYPVVDCPFTYSFCTLLCCCLRLLVNVFRERLWCRQKLRVFVIFCYSRVSLQGVVSVSLISCNARLWCLDRIVVILICFS